MITQERLKEALHYNPITGFFVWIKPAKNSRASPGDIAGWHDERGYIRIEVDGCEYKAHRLAWFYVHDEWPPAGTDHKDRVKDHNWISNIRPATQAQNVANTDVRKDSTLGVKGVRQRGKKFLVQMRVDGKIKHLGVRDTVEAAQALYSEAAVKQFGSFARL